MGVEIEVEPGERYGRWTVIKEAEKAISPNGKKRRQFLCECECGSRSVVLLGNLRREASTQCQQCRLDEFYDNGITHGLSGTPIYNAWNTMLNRCENSRAQSYPRYGGRGIRVCPRWHLFENFYADMGPRLSDEHSIDRIDSDGDYEPGNCRWATREEQARNTSRNRFVTFNGETIAAAELAEIAGFTGQQTRAFLDEGFPPELIYAAGRQFVDEKGRVCLPLANTYDTPSAPTPGIGIHPSRRVPARDLFFD